jgi:glycopeptide antibiotics resistance protein
VTRGGVWDRRREGGDSSHDRTLFVRVEAPPISRPMGWSSLLLYIIFLGWLTLTPRPGTPSTSPDWIPYSSLEPVLANLWIVTRHPEYMEFIDLEALKHVVGNVLLFMPLGWLLPLLWDGAISTGRIVAVAGSTSLAIEVCQLSIPGRMSTIDDVILNALGAGIGAMILFWGERVLARGIGPHLRAVERPPI